MVLHAAAPVGKGLQHLGLKVRPQSVVGAGTAVPVEVPADEPVQLLVLLAVVVVALGQLAGDLALLGPLGKQLGPVAEVDGGHTVHGLVMQDIHGAFAVGHDGSPFSMYWREAHSLASL